MLTNSITTNTVALPNGSVETTITSVSQENGVWSLSDFDLHGHPKAKRAYAWGHLDGQRDERTWFVAVREIPPVESAEAAVKVQIVKDFKGNK
jgi:hypothetical protein